ncbi:MAG: FAD-dependent oxidoreductase, partial [Pseudomonadota bacterium]
MFKIAVIGRGLFGSAAARHLAEMWEGIAVIGPDEPESRAEHSGVFASHYDEGRMTRRVDPMPELAATAGAAIARYRDIEARSGISFYTPSGYLGLGHPGSSYNALCAANGGRIGADIEELDTAALRARYPFLAVDDGADGLVERGAAGHISPRRLVRAQTVLAESAGAEVIRQPARDIRAVKGGVEITLWDGTLVAAEKVLVTTGAFTGTLTGHAGLSAAALGLTVFGRTTVLVRTEGDVFEALKDMPT